MARQQRFVLPGYPQHVIQRGSNDHSIFGAEADQRFYLSVLRESAVRYRCLVHAYVLMRNHVHLLVTPMGEDGIGRLMQSLGRRYAHHFNRRYGRTGTLWEGRYRATILDCDEYLLRCYRYVELNPVRAGMAAYAGDYRWSSYAYNAHGDPDILIEPHPVYLLLGRSREERIHVYRDLFRVPIDPHDLDEIRDATNKARVLGDDRFKGCIESLSQTG